MKILADENIPYVREAFASLGEVETMPGRAMNMDVVHNVSVLLVRSITKVNRALLEGSAVQFVATATIGEDHVDKEFLASRNIGFASAPGSNANSVAQYVTAALLTVAHRLEFKLERKKLGIIGVGNVGKRVLAKAEALGLECVLNDPPLAREAGDAKYRPIEEIHNCDIVTLHVPLTKEGEDATYHLADEAFLLSLKPGAILINTSRGPVADNDALKRALDDGHLRACVLDVWEGEPEVDLELLEKVAIGTPHIAGYSFDGKVNGTRQIYESACQFFEVQPDWDPAPLLPAPECPEVQVQSDAPGPEKALREAVLAVYDISKDDAAMRGLLACSPERQGAEFDRLRKEYPRRREFFNTSAVVDPPDEALKARLAGLGFKTED